MMMDEVNGLDFDILRKLKMQSPKAVVVLAAEFALACSHLASAQVQREPASAPFSSFEVASIRPSKTGDDSPMIRPTADGMRIRASTPWNLIDWAYGIHQYGDHPIIGLPRWANSDRYDIEARASEADAEALLKLSSNDREDKLEVMLQSLLAERFLLTLHKKPIELPILKLVVAKGGPKLKEGKADVDFPRGLIQMKPGQIIAKGVPIVRLAEVLGVQVERGVVDATDIKGTYDFTLEWEPRENLRALPTEIGDGAADASPLGGSSSHPPIFTALQEQLGLKLVTAKGLGEALVIDHIETPSPN